MADGTIRWDQTVDPFGKNGGSAKYELNSRDPFRTPFHWNNWPNAGEYTWSDLVRHFFFHFPRIRVHGCNK